MENTRQTKTKMTAAERKGKQRVKAQANVIEEEKHTYKEKENQRQSQLRKLQIVKMTKEERSNFCAKEVAWVTASRQRKKEVKPDPPFQVKIPAKNPYKLRQSYGKALNRCQTELPNSPQNEVAVVSGLAKEVGLSIQNDYEKQCHENPGLTEKLKEAVKELFFRSDVSYTMPGAKDEMVVWDEFGKKRLRKYYLTTYLREAYAVFQETRQEDEEMCSFSVFCKLRPKNVLPLSDTPEDTSQCQTHENLFLKLDAMGCSHDSSFWGEVIYNTSIKML